MRKLSISRQQLKPVDLKTFVELFTDHIEKQKCMKLMLEEISEANKHNQPYKLYMFRKKYNRANRNAEGFYPHIISEVWKSLIGLGLIHRERKGASVKLSKKFCTVVNGISEYWNTYVDSYKQ